MSTPVIASGQITISALIDGKQGEDGKSLVINVISSRGAHFHEDTDSTVLRAIVFLNMVEVDLNGTEYMYRWFKIDNNGERVNFIDGSVHKLGKVITVNADEVETKAVFHVELLRSLSG